MYALGPAHLGIALVINDAGLHTAALHFGQGVQCVPEVEKAFCPQHQLLRGRLMQTDGILDAVIAVQRILCLVAGDTAAVGGLVSLVSLQLFCNLVRQLLYKGPAVRIIVRRKNLAVLCRNDNLILRKGLFRKNFPCNLCQLIQNGFGLLRILRRQDFLSVRVLEGNLDFRFRRRFFCILPIQNILSCAVNLDFHGGTVLTAILLALGIGTAFGLVQGFLIAYLEIQPFIVTLAGMFFAKGMTTIVNATQFNVENEAFKALKETRIYVPGMGSVNKLGAYVPAYVEIGVVVALVVVAVLFVVLRWTRIGRSVYAVGGNSYSANMLAINVKRTKFLAHLICGILAGIGGFVYFLHVGSGSPSHASGAEMNAIAASIIGGTMLTGGVGNIIGTFFGVLSLSTIKNIVSSLGLDEAWWTNITVAGMICLFLVIQSLVLSRKNKDS